MSRLVTFGCSNTYGEGLSDCWVDNQAGPYPSKLAWPQLLADELNLECVNLSGPGTSNKQICNDVLNTEFEQSDIVVIVWSYFSRTCFFQDKGKSKRIMVQDATNKNFSRKINKYSLNYYNIYYTQHNSNIESYMYVNLSESVLSKKRIKNYHFTCNTSQRGLTYNLSPPQWNRIDLTNVNDCFIDTALDNAHPGTESHKQVSKKIKQHIQGEYNDI